MRLHRRLLLVGAISALALALNPVSAALANTGNDANLIKATFTPSTPTDPAIDGVPAAGAPWILAKGEVRVRSNGRTDVLLQGLQIPGRNPDGSAANPVPGITASLYCGGMLAAVSALEPLSVPDGDARFRVTLDVPKTCDMATVLINPNGNPKAYIASAMAAPDDED
jgi:hypothetical protein